MGRLITRILAFTLDHPRQVLVGFVALSLIVLTGFARGDVDTDPSRLLTAGAGPDQTVTDDGQEELIVTIVGEQSLLTDDVLAAMVRLHSAVEDIDGVDAPRVVSIADAITGAVPTTRPELNELSARIRGDSALDDIVLSDDRMVMTLVVPLEPEVSPRTVSAAVSSAITDAAGLDEFEHHVTSFDLAEQRVADDLYGQLLIRTFVGWLLAFVVLAAMLRQVVLAAVASVVVAAATVWALAISAGFGATVLVTSALVPAAALVVAIIHVVRPITAYVAHPGVIEEPHRVIASTCGDAARVALSSDSIVIVSLIALAVAETRYRAYAWSLVAAFVVAWFVSLVVLPAALAVLDSKFLTVSAETDTDTGILASLSWMLPSSGVRLRESLLAGVAVIVGIGSVGLGTAALDDNPLRWIRGSSEEAVDIRAAAEFGIGATSASLRLEADLTNQLTATATLDALDELTRVWDEDPSIGASMAYTTLVADGDAAARRDAFVALSTTHAHGAALVDPRADTATVKVWLRDGDADTARHLIDLTASQLRERPLNRGIDVSWSGEAIANIDWQQEVVRDPARRMLIAVAAGVIAALVIFASLRWAIIALAPAAVIYLAVFGFLGWKDGVHGLASSVGGILLVVFAVEAGATVAALYRSCTQGTWSAREAAAELGSGTGRGIVVAGATAGVAMVPLALADQLPNGRGGSLLLIGAGFGALWALVMVAATASGPPKNTAPLTVRGASPA